MDTGGLKVEFASERDETLNSFKDVGQQIYTIDKTTSLLEEECKNISSKINKIKSQPKSTPSAAVISLIPEETHTPPVTPPQENLHVHTTTDNETELMIFFDSNCSFIDFRKL